MRTILGFLDVILANYQYLAGEYVLIELERVLSTKLNAKSPDYFSDQVNDTKPLITRRVFLVAVHSCIKDAELVSFQV